MKTTSKKINVLFDIGHPAHFHLFKNFILFLKERGIQFFIVTRNKEITNTLIKYYGYDYLTLSNPGGNLFTMVFELIKRDLSIFNLQLKHKFTHAFGTSVSIAHLSAISKVKSYNFNEDDDAVVPLYARLTYPFTTKIINPDCISHDKWKGKRVFVPSYHELAYLHPNSFTPDKKILEKYRLHEKKYVIFRLSALKAHHDIGANGISAELRHKIVNLLADFEIIESKECKTGNKIEPWDMHHILSFAKMIISDSQTMAAEAMVLGTPSIRINTFVGKISYLEELENHYQLGYGFLPYDEKEILKRVGELTAKN
ncbi:MAG: DUF354 domain-containing protein, partial [Bacteroidota bacterium]